MRWLVPSMRPISLLVRPFTTRSSTSRSRGVSVARRACTSARSACCRRRWRPSCMACCTRCTRCSGSNGFSMKSRAPSRMALTARGTSAAPVRKMVGSCMPRRRSSACTSRPLSPGMRTSSTRHTALASSGAASSASPEAKQRTGRRAEWNRRCSAVSMAGSSSTTSTAPSLPPTAPGIPRSIAVMGLRFASASPARLASHNRVLLAQGVGRRRPPRFSASACAGRRGPATSPAADAGR